MDNAENIISLLLVTGHYLATVVVRVDYFTVIA
jgi:hypothetical protein